MILAAKRVSRLKLDRIETNNYISGLFSRGVQPSMDSSEPPNRVIEASIGYAASIGVACMDEIAIVNERVRPPFPQHFFA